MTNVVVTGAGGFIGHHLVTALKGDGHFVRGVDVKLPEFEPSRADEFLQLDLRSHDDAIEACDGADEIWALAASMGGMGYITHNDADILRDNLLITVNTLHAATLNGVRKIIYTSSACVYPNYMQRWPSASGLREDTVMPADPQHGYGWEKLTGEKILAAYGNEHRISVRVPRLHAIYGPLGTWQGGREKAPAALCRKVAEAPDGGYIDVWGDGKQTRSFCYVDDCIEGLLRLSRSAWTQPLNIGSGELVSIDELARVAIAASGKDLRIRHVIGPEGVRGRNSDNARCRQVLGWEPSVSLKDGIARTYPWVAAQVAARAVAA